MVRKEIDFHCRTSLLQLSYYLAHIIFVSAQIKHYIFKSWSLQKEAAFGGICTYLLQFLKTIGLCQCQHGKSIFFLTRLYSISVLYVVYA